MPFRSEPYVGTYSPEEIEILQQVYNRSCSILGLCPTKNEDKNTLAGIVIRVFESGTADIETLAQKVVGIARNGHAL